jgi:hypothetical protein
LLKDQLKGASGPEGYTAALARGCRVVDGACAFGAVAACAISISSSLSVSFVAASGMHAQFPHAYSLASVDVWDGDDGPVIYNGYTASGRVALRPVLEAIAAAGA